MNDNEEQEQQVDQVEPKQKSRARQYVENKAKDKLKDIWNKIPLRWKLYALAALGSVIFTVLPIVILISASPINFLFYSDNVQEGDKEVDEAYSEYWTELCSESNSKACNEDQKKAAEELKKDQTAFYDRLDALTDAHLSKNPDDKKEQRYIILTTVFYGYEIDDLTQGSKAFTLDDPNNNEMTVTEENAVDENNVYRQERDTLKELVKQFKTTVPMCEYDSQDEAGNPERPSVEIKNGDESFVFNWFDKISYNMGWYQDEVYQEAERTQCKEKYQGLNPKAKIVDVNEGEASKESFYKYLRTSEYLDKKEHLKNYYIDYAKSHGLSSDVASWVEEDKIAVREAMIEDIKNIVETGMTAEEENRDLAYAVDIDYWWPIGSKETTKIDGKLFATGTPRYTGVTSKFGNRTGEFAGFHGGVDLEAWDGDESDTAYIIASRSGVVERAVNVCAPFTPDAGCGYGWGNHVLITNGDGKQQNYAHLSEVYVKSGEEVQQGQVIGRAGNSGDSGAVHLHFEMWVNGERVNPLHSETYMGYINQDIPRPVIKKVEVTEDMSKLIALVDCLEGVTGGSADENGMYTVEWGADGVFTVGHGVVLEYNIPRFAKYGIDAKKYMYTGAKIPKTIGDNVRTDVIMDGYTDINKALLDNQIVLDFDQVSSLISFKYNWGSINDFIPVYKKYGNTLGLRDNFFLHPSNIGSSPGSIYYGGHTTRRNDEWQLFHNHVWRCYGNELKFNQ